MPALARWWRGDLPAGADTAIHLFRAVQLDWAVRHGYLYPRWSPDLVFGFGYPLFLVHGPLAQYVIVAFHALGLSFLAATLAAFALADGLGALGAWALARRLGRSELAGVAASAAYAFAPYVLGSLYRGSPAEALALGLLPWVLLAFLRLLAQPSAGRLALAEALYALLPLLHTPSTVLGSLALGAAVAAAALTQWGGWRATARRLTWPALAVGLGLLLAATYWLPVAAEVGAIQIARAYNTGVLDYHNNFLSVRELFAAPQTFDPLLIGWAAPRSYGWPALLLALAALLGWRRLKHGQRAALVLALAGAALAGALTLPGAVWVWEHLPGLSLVQFPVRLLGPGSLALAVAAGLAFANRSATRGPVLVLALSVAAGALFGLAWTWQFGDPLTPANPTLVDLHAYEQRSGAIGTTTAGEYLPVGVQQAPPPETLAARYAAGAPILRLDESRLPSGAVVAAQSAGVITQSVTLDTPAAFEAVFAVFNFPGWRAAVDGAEVPISTTTPYGLIAVPVPAGTHTVALTFGTTPPRQVGSFISALGLVVLAGLAVVAWRGQSAPQTLTTQLPALGGAAWAVAGVGLALLAVRLWAGQTPTPYARTRFDGAAVAGLAHPLDLPFSDQMALLGYDQSAEAAASGGALEVTLYWRALQPLSVDYSTVLTLQDAEGQVYAQADSQHPAGFPTSRWRLDQYGRDGHHLQLLAGTPPGAYVLVANVYRYPDLTALTAGLDIGMVTVTRPARPAELAVSPPLAAPFGALVLAGVALGQTEAGVGADVPLDVVWRVLSAPVTADALRVSLLAADGRAAATQDLALTGAPGSAAQWQPGDVWRAKRRFRVPAETPSGSYTVTLAALAGGQPLGAAVPVGALRVSAPERTYAAPPLAHSAAARFGGVAELVGWAWQADGTLTLAWRALSTADTSYSVFVHLRDGAGEIFRQHDGPPANGARPTTSWLAGEVIVETYQFETPPGAFSLAVGLYDPRTSARLILPDGADQLVLRP
ncbi:MAG: hypothetical protein IT317_23260 [Anaerolineales bacterium]|nr:hypothetical protein [Anaerolineales bacterium]